MIQYSLMLEYVRFVPVQDASYNLEKLAHLVPVLDYHGESYHSSKGFAISQLQKTSETLRFNFKNDVIGKLLQASDTQLAFEEYLKGLYHQGVIDMDDFTIVGCMNRKKWKMKL